MHLYSRRRRRSTLEQRQSEIEVRNASRRRNERSLEITGTKGGGGKWQLLPRPVSETVRAPRRVDAEEAAVAKERTRLTRRKHAGPG